MRHYNLPLDVQKHLMIGAFTNYTKALREVHNFNGLRELRYFLKDFSDTLRSSKKHRKQKH